MKLFGSTKKINRRNKKRGKKYPSSLSISVQCNLVDNQYQQKYELLYTFTPNESYAYLLNTEPSNLLFLKIYNTEFDKIIIKFTDYGRPLQTEDKLNLKLLINK